MSQPKQLKNQQNQKNSEICPFDISIPADQLITLRTVRFVKGRQIEKSMCGCFDVLH